MRVLTVGETMAVLDPPGEGKLAHGRLVAATRLSPHCEGDGRRLVVSGLYDGSLGLPVRSLPRAFS
jgi:hypothetical protein